MWRMWEEGTKKSNLQQESVAVAVQTPFCLSSQPADKFSMSVGGNHMDDNVTLNSNVANVGRRHEEEKATARGSSSSSSDPILSQFTDQLTPSVLCRRESYC